VRRSGNEDSPGHTRPRLSVCSAPVYSEATPSDLFPDRHVRIKAKEVRHAGPRVCDQREGLRAQVSSGSIRLFGRDAYVGAALASVKVTFFESLEGLEARVNDQCVAVLQDYRTFRHMPCYDWRHLPLVLYFEQYERVTWSANC
jgi:hypothetical protein